MSQLTNILHLEKGDISPDGKLADHVNPGNKYPKVIIMIQGDFCGYCTQMKPSYQKLSDSSDDVLCTTIKIDGSDAEKELSAAVKNFVKEIQGVPAIISFKDGQYKDFHKGGRSVDDLRGFIQQSLG